MDGYNPILIPNVIQLTEIFSLIFIEKLHIL